MSKPATIKFSRNAQRHKPRAQTAAHALPRKSSEVACHRNIFILAVHPDKWDFREASGDKPAAFLPVTRQIPIAPGVEGVGAGGNAKRLRSSLAEKGNIIIDPNDPRLGPWQDCVAMYPVDDGGNAYVFAGTVPSIRSGGKVRWTPAGDWDDFRAHLVTANIVPPPDDEAMGDLIRIQTKVTGRIRQLVAVSKRPPEDLERATAKLDAMKALLREYQSEDEPETKSTKKGAK